MISARHVAALAVASLFVLSHSLRAETAGLPDKIACGPGDTVNMCLIKQRWSVGDKQPVEERTAIYGLSDHYYVVTRSSDWVKRTNPKQQSDLVLIQNNLEAMVEITWQEGVAGDHETIARDQLTTFIEILGSEPTRLDVGWEPFKSNGTLFRICYTTTKNDGECIFSGAVNIDGGMATMLGPMLATDELSLQIEEIMTSIDLPRADNYDSMD